MMRLLQNTLAIVLFSLLSMPILEAQQVSAPFWTGRMQQETNPWQEYAGSYFDLIYQKKDEQLIRNLLPFIEKDYRALCSLYEYRFRKRTKIIIYSNFEQYKTSKINIPEHDINSGGKTIIKKPILEVYYKESIEKTRLAIKKQYSKLIFSYISQGKSLKKLMQINASSNLASWYTEGVIAYSVYDWDTEKDNALRTAFLSRDYANFLEFAKANPELAGHSLLHFLEQTYNESSISNLIYLTRINRNINSGFLYVFGKTFYQLVSEDWYNFYRIRYSNDNSVRRFPNAGELKITQKKSITTNNFLLSPDAKTLVYNKHKLGKTRTIAFDIETGKSKTLYKTGIKTYDKRFQTQYPLLSITPEGKLVKVFWYKNKLAYNHLNLKVSTSKWSKPTLLESMEGIHSVQATRIDKLLVTGFRNGQTDVYEIIGKRLNQLTRDSAPAKNATYCKLNNTKGIAFIGETNSTPNTKHTDIFFIDMENKEVSNITQTPFVNEQNIIASKDAQTLTFLSDENGIFNRFIATLDSTLIREDEYIVLEDGSELLVHPDSFYSHLKIISSYKTPISELRLRSYANTDYNNSIALHQITNNKVLDVFETNNSKRLFLRQFTPSRDMGILRKTTLSSFINTKYLALKRTPPPATDSALVSPKTDSQQVVPKDSTQIDIDNYQFQSEFNTVKEPQHLQKETEPDNAPPIVLLESKDGLITAQKSSPEKVATPKVALTDKDKMWDKSAAKALKKTLNINRVTFQMDNTPLYNNLNMYLGGPYVPTPIGLRFDLGFQNLFETMQIDLGCRLPTNFNGAEYFVDVTQKKSSIQQKYSFYRGNNRNDVLLSDTASGVSAVAPANFIKNLIQAQFTYPLKKHQALRLTTGLQVDQIVIIAQDLIGLSVPNYYENRLQLNVEYIFDNSFRYGINTLKGTRFKAYASAFQPMDILVQGKLKPKFKAGLTNILGFDLRHYLVAPDKKTVLAFRASGATSMGKEKILFAMGGVENQFTLFEEQNTTLNNYEYSLPDATTVAYQTLAGNMRGFTNNARNGNSYGLLSAELRIPLAGLLSKPSSENLFMKNMQLVGFFDIGTAWPGFSPFSNTNPINSIVIDNNGPNSTSPVKMTLFFHRNPIIMSPGFGFRTILFGHYIKLDFAWGVEDNVATPRTHFSIGTDF